MSTDFELLGQRLKILRKNYNLNQKEFSKKINISSATLSAYEIGAKNPSTAVLKKIHEEFNVSIDWICGLSNRESTEIKIEKYSDIIKVLLSIDNNMNLSIKQNLDSPSGAISFDDDELNHYLLELKKFKDLYKNNSIDASIYTACIEKLLRDSDIYISLDDVIPPDSY